MRSADGMSPDQCGINRFRMRYRIRESLEERGLSMSDIARNLGISCAAVSATIKGRNHSKRTLDALRQAGVPEKLLFSPSGFD